MHAMVCRGIGTIWATMLASWTWIGGVTGPPRSANAAPAAVAPTGFGCCRAAFVLLRLAVLLLVLLVVGGSSGAYSREEGRLILLAASSLISSWAGAREGSSGGPCRQLPLLLMAMASSTTSLKL